MRRDHVTLDQIAEFSGKLDHLNAGHLPREVLLKPRICLLAHTHTIDVGKTAADGLHGEGAEVGGEGVEPVEGLELLVAVVNVEHLHQWST